MALAIGDEIIHPGICQSATALSIPVSPSTSPEPAHCPMALVERSEEHTSELQSLMRISYAVFCLKKKKNHSRLITKQTHYTHHKNKQETEQRPTTILNYK